MFQPTDDTRTIITINLPTALPGGYTASNDATIQIQRGTRAASHRFTYRGFDQDISEAIHSAEDQLRNSF